MERDEYPIDHVDILVHQLLPCRCRNLLYLGKPHPNLQLESWGRTFGKLNANKCTREFSKSYKFPVAKTTQRKAWHLTFSS